MTNDPLAVDGYRTARLYRLSKRKRHSVPDWGRRRMEISAANRVVIRLDASVFEKNVGDLVKKGEILGRFADGTVESPFDAVIESVSFDADSHTLVVTLVEA